MIESHRTIRTFVRTFVVILEMTFVFYVKNIVTQICENEINAYHWNYCSKLI